MKPSAGSAESGDDAAIVPVLDPQFKHDLLNRIGAAKMNAEMASRHAALPEAIRKNLDRVLQNLLQAQKMIEDEKIDGGSDSSSSLPSLSKTGDAKTTESASTSAANEVGSTSASTPPSGPERSSIKKRILLIDDSADLRALFTAVLKPRGYEIAVASDEASALKTLAANEAFDLILLDYSLGAKTGSDVLDTLETMHSKALKDSKIVLFTGFGDQVQDRRAFAVEQKSMDIASMIRLIQKYT